ncbi:hypothetical protein [Silvanigrella aquatica]|uniref:Polyketide cyclase n=1 Tax=Silvanigrella aquatica TaxID=1915309 RepID=A0A1L4D224_9BACT|nr:hypothetical protein [Silvanigrella aquatica]APJ04244.1 hypothetical protein AXG55_10125 [Silvanigrella aquatica]
MKQYIIEHSEVSSKITAEKVWQVWKNVNSWTTWDKRLESTLLLKWQNGLPHSVKNIISAIENNK